MLKNQPCPTPPPPPLWPRWQRTFIVTSKAAYNTSKDRGLVLPVKGEQTTAYVARQRLMLQDNSVWQILKRIIQQQFVLLRDRSLVNSIMGWPLPFLSDLTLVAIGYSKCNLSFWLTTTIRWWQSHILPEDNPQQISTGKALGKVLETGRRLVQKLKMCNHLRET